MYLPLVQIFLSCTFRMIMSVGGHMLFWFVSLVPQNVILMFLFNVSVKDKIGTWRQMNEDMKQMSKGYETARKKKGTSKTRRQTKQIYIQ